MMPNVVLTAPANDVEMKLALEFAMGCKGPVVIRYPKDSVPDDSLVRAASKKPFELGKSVKISGSRASPRSSPR